MIEPIQEYDWIIETNALRMIDEPQLTPIPNNIILNKVITGWGATFSEIRADRHSILILPHKCQINNKHADHHTTDYTFPVTEKQTTTNLVNHIINRRGRKVKFLSTPEGLGKVIAAIQRTGGNPYTEYFLLLDEFHKLTKDSGYRVNITSAMSHFFKFDNKAMISATPFKPTHPGFKEFKLTKVQHQREVKKDIELFTVNNLGAAFKEYIDNYKGELLFIFFNSLNGIHALMQNCNLQDSANAYCSEDGVKDFDLKNFKNAFKEIKPKQVAKYNFLTSSFFNGLDITGLEKVPDILILTDIKYVAHTIIDPNTDTYQILGRFRPDNYEDDQRDRYNSATHIINTRHNAAVKLEDTAIEEFLLSKRRYDQLIELQATATDEFFRDEVYGEALKRVKPFYNLLDGEGDFDFFKFDNYLYEYRLKMCYGHEIAPGLTYIKSGLFNLEERRKLYLPEEFETMSKGMKRYSKEGILWACKMLIANENQQGTPGADEFYFELAKRFPMVIRAVKLLGYERIEQLKFNKRLIEKEILKDDIQNKRVHHGVIDAVYKSFIINTSYPVEEVKSKLQSIFDDLDLKANAKSTDIKTYFIVREYNGYKKLLKRELKQLSLEDEEAQGVYERDGVKGKSVRMYYLVEKKHNAINPNSTRPAQFNKN
jgi:hypothetical protein